MSANQYTSVYPSAVDVLSGPVSDVALLWADPNREQFKAVTAEVSRTVRRVERVRNLPSIASGSGLAIGYLGENGHSEDVANPGDDRLRVSDGAERHEIQELALGVPEAGLLVATANPLDEDLLAGVDDRRVRGVDPADFSTRAAIPSELTVAANDWPTTALSARQDQGLVRVDAPNDEGGLNRIGIGFLNTTANSITPTVNVYGLTYRISAISEAETAKNVLFGNTNRPTRRLMYGGLESFSPGLPDDWESGVLELEASDIGAVVRETAQQAPAPRRAPGGD